MSTRPEDHRRKWDREEYERLAEERKRAEVEREEEQSGSKKGPPVKRELLKQRDYRIDLDSKLGKSIVINKNTPTSQSGGYYCNVCDCVVKDSINFLDHINGKKHQRNLGRSDIPYSKEVWSRKDFVLFRDVDEDRTQLVGRGQEPVPTEQA